ncbi:MAG: hypothetical protein LBD46_07405 [Endomicrobium sp.]|nr:hypothetical protein [Endomicrobium sp.]
MRKTILIKKFLIKTTALFAAVSLLLCVIPAVEAKASYVDKFSVPSYSGKITAAEYYGGNEIVINIQDLHCHAQAQRNIAKIIGYLDEKYGLENVYLEGAFGEVDTTALYLLKRDDTGKGILETLIDSGYMSGSEYYAAVNGKNNFIRGIENRELYLENIGLYNEIIEAISEVESICKDMVIEIKGVKTEYSNPDIRNYERLIKRYEKRKISTKRYYGKTAEIAAINGINLDDYKNIKDYVELTALSEKLNGEKISKQFKKFAEVLKAKIAYGQYFYLLSRSNNFVNLEDISEELSDISQKYGIFEEYKFEELERFFAYMQRSREFNPVLFTKEEEKLREKIYEELGRTRYEREVSFLHEFIPKIKGYFTAEITAEDLAGFKEGFKKFRDIWRSYFSENKAKKLDKYAQLLERYHENNLRRDKIFVDRAGLQDNKAAKNAKIGNEALIDIERAGKKNIKVIVTGGFHSAGLEKMLKEKKITHLIITPKITKEVPYAHEIYLETIKSYKEIKKNTINIQAFSQLKIDLALPKLIGVALFVLKEESDVQKEEGIKRFIKENFLKERKEDAQRGEILTESFKITEQGRKYIFAIEGRSYEAVMEEDGVRVIEIMESNAKRKILTAEDNRKYIKEAKNLLFIFRNFMKDKTGKVYKAAALVIGPVAEEFVFRSLPFFIPLFLIGSPLALPISIAVSLISGLIFFPAFHEIIDRLYSDGIGDVRTFKRMIPDSFKLTALYLAPAIPLALLASPAAAAAIALAFSVIAHIVNNVAVYFRWHRGIMLSIFAKDAVSPDDRYGQKIKKAVKELRYLKNREFRNNGKDWQLNGEIKAEYETILADLENAVMLNGEERLGFVSEYLQNLLALTVSKIKMDNNFYPQFMSFLSDAVSEIGTEIHIENGMTISDKYSEEMTKALIMQLEQFLAEFDYRYDKDKQNTLDEIRSQLSSLNGLSDNNELYQLLNKIFLERKVVSETLLHAIIALSIVVKDNKDGKPFFQNIFSLLKREMDEIAQSYKMKSPDNSIKKRVHSISTYVHGAAAKAYSVSAECAMALLTHLYDLGLSYIGNYGLTEMARNYSSYRDYEKFYNAVVKDKNIDIDIVSYITEAVDALDKILVTDKELNTWKERITDDMRNLSKTANEFFFPLVDMLSAEMIAVSNRMQLEGDEQWRLAAAVVITLLTKIVEKTNSPTSQKTTEGLNKIMNNINYEEDLFKKIKSFFLLEISLNANEASHEYLYRKILEISKKQEIPKSEVLKLLEELAVALFYSSGKNFDVERNIFKDFGVNAETVTLIINALQNNKKRPPSRYKIHLPTRPEYSWSREEDNISYSEELVDLLVKSADIIDTVSFTTWLVSSSEKEGKETALAVVDKMFAIAEDISVNKEKRIETADMIANIMTYCYSYMSDSSVLRINSIFNSLGMPAYIVQPGIYISPFKLEEYEKKEEKKSLRQRDSTSHNDRFNIISLLSHLPEGIVPLQSIRQKNPLYFSSKGNTDASDKDVAKLISEFENFKEILKFNALALQKMSTINADSSKKDLYDVLQIVEKMIVGLEKINPHHGRELRDALTRIKETIVVKENITSDFINSQLKLRNWNEREIYKIDNIHVLINAVHQISINDFKHNIKSNGIISDKIRVVKASRQDYAIGGHDLSDFGKINKNIADLFIKLASKELHIDDFIFKDDILIWSTRLFAHSVDIFFNFGETDRGIAIHYHEGGRSLQYMLRVDYFADALRKLGFRVDADLKIDSHLAGACGLEAVLNKDSGLNDSKDLVYIAYMAIMLFKHSTNLDIQLEGVYDKLNEESYNMGKKELIKKFMSDEIWYGYNYNSNGRTAFGFDYLSPELTNTPDNPGFKGVREYLNRILVYLRLDEIPELKEYYINQNILDEYFNRPLERAYIQGKIIINERNELIPNENYNEFEPFKSILLTKEFIRGGDNDSAEQYDMLMQARLMNLAGKMNFNYKQTGLIGKLAVVNGFYKVSEGYLSLKGLMSHPTGRMKYAVSEVINYDGERKKLNHAELASFLEKHGYGPLVSDGESEVVGRRERIGFSQSIMEEKIVRIESPEILAVATSMGNGTYVSGDITFEKENAENKILVVPYTTPNDIEAIEKVRAVITTGGGVLSHAAIITREFRKPSVTLNKDALLYNGKLHTIYYELYGKPLTLSNDVEAIEVKESHVSLSSGDKVLVNGETGSILLFNDVDNKILNEIQEYIDENNEKAFKKFLLKYADHKHIGRFVEYVYFQVIGDVRLNNIMFTLIDREMPKVIKDKVGDLNATYVQKKLNMIRDSLLNLTHSGDTDINIVYIMVENLANKLNSIKTTDSIKDMFILSMKSELNRMRKQINNRYLEYMKEKINYVSDFISKTDLSPQDVNEAVKMLSLASVYNYFTFRSGQDEVLIKTGSELANLLNEMSKKVSFYQNAEKISLENEVLNFEHIFEKDVHKFGSKTTELASITRGLENEKGVSVPKGVGISKNVFEIYFELADRSERYKELKRLFESSIINKDDTAAKTAAMSIKSLIDEIRVDKTALEKIDKDIKMKIDGMLDKNKKYSVRTSGIGEDGESMAFAGMGETNLNVSYEFIFKNVEECWKSFYSDRSIKYMIENAVIVNPAVIIQEMADVKKAGVAFSRDKYGNTIIEIVYGLGEGLVSGRITPDSITVDNNSREVIEYSVVDKHYMITPLKSGEGTELAQVSKGVKARALNAGEIKLLTDIIMRLEKSAGYPVDIEFALGTDGQLYILQRRAITDFKTSTVVNTDKEIALISASGNSEHSVCIGHPSLEDISVEVYYSKVSENTLVLSVDEKYKDLCRNQDFLLTLSERIGNDPVIRKRINSLTGSKWEIAEGISPDIDLSYHDFSDEVATAKNKLLVLPIKDLLSAA